MDYQLISMLGQSSALTLFLGILARRAGKIGGILHEIAALALWMFAAMFPFSMAMTLTGHMPSDTLAKAMDSAVSIIGSTLMSLVILQATFRRRWPKEKAQ